MSLDPVLWTAQTRILRNQPFSFDGRDYLLPIYRDDADEILISKGRQTEFSEYAVNFLLHNLWKHRGSIGLYVSARGSQTSKFSKLRIKKWAIGNSPIMQEIAPLRNHTATQLTLANASELYFHSAWESFEEARSIPADFVVIDEAQSVAINEIDVIKETLAHSNHGKLRVIGTGSPADSDWHKAWKKGSQYHWDKKSMSWIAKNPSAKTHSYWIPQTIVPWISEGMIEEKRNEMTHFRFMTEVMGEFPEGQAKPITEQMMMKCMDKSLSFQTPDEIDRTLGFLTDGTDWGGGDKAFTIWWLMQEVNGKFVVRYLEKIEEPDVAKQAKIIEARRNAYMPDRGVMDAGGGTFQVQQLQKIFGHGLTKAMYITRPADPYEMKDVWKKNLVMVDRTFSLDTLIDIIRSGRLVIPAEDWEKVEWIIDMFTAIESETVNVRAGGTHVRYIHDEANPDDALHAFNYAKLANYLLHHKRSSRGVVATGGLGR